MSIAKPTVLITGIAGHLAMRLLPHLVDFSVVGIDVNRPQTESPLRFEKVDLGREPSCRQMVDILRQTGATAVAHLAFVADPLRAGGLDRDRMWQINVAGTARVMEAITEVNRMGGNVRTFVFPSSVTAYGSDLPYAVREDYPLGGHTLPFAIHKREADEVVQLRAATLGGCNTYVLRPQILAGPGVDNYLLATLRGVPTGRGRLAARMRARGTRLPLMLPYGTAYLQKRFQFLHIDDMARLLAHVLRRPDPPLRVTTLNVAGRGESLTQARCAESAGSEIKRLPGRWACEAALRIMWNLGISSVPPEALPYLIGSYLMDTGRLRAFLGSDYEHVIRYTIADALADSFAPATAPNDAEIRQIV
jgi:nucleoside-diphosphate-sugar epimerase